MQIKYGQIELLCSYKETSEGQNEMNLVFVNEFAVVGINLLRDTVTGGTCFHIVSLLEVPVKRTVVGLESILGKLCPQCLVLCLLYISLTNLKGTKHIMNSKT